jgi:hypothetical protein
VIPLANAPTLHLDFSDPDTALAAGVAPIGGFAPPPAAAEPSLELSMEDLFAAPETDSLPSLDDLFAGLSPDAEPEPQAEGAGRTSNSTMMGMTGLAPPVQVKPPPPPPVKAKPPAVKPTIAGVPPAPRPKPPAVKPTIAGVPPAPIALQHPAQADDDEANTRPTDKMPLPEPETTSVGTYRLTRKSLNARDEIPGAKRKR